MTVSTWAAPPSGAQKKPPVRTLRVRTGDFRVGLLVSRLTLRRVIRPTDSEEMHVVCQSVQSGENHSVSALNAPGLFAGTLESSKCDVKMMSLCNQVDHSCRGRVVGFSLACHVVEHQRPAPVGREHRRIGLRRRADPGPGRSVRRSRPVGVSVSSRYRPGPGSVVIR